MNPTTSALTMFCSFRFGRKVRCHNCPVDYRGRNPHSAKSAGMGQPHLGKARLISHPCRSFRRRHARKTHCKGGLGCVLTTSEPAAAREEAVADQGPDRQPSVRVADFLALHGRARRGGGGGGWGPGPHTAGWGGVFFPPPGRGGGCGRGNLPGFFPPGATL